MELQPSANSGDHLPASAKPTAAGLSESLLAAVKRVIAIRNSEAADLVDEQLKKATAHGSCFVAALLEALQRVWPVIADAMTTNQSADAEAVALMMARVNVAVWTLLAKQMEPVAAEILAMETMASSTARCAHVLDASESSSFQVSSSCGVIAERNSLKLAKRGKHFVELKLSANSGDHLPASAKPTAAGFSESPLAAAKRVMAIRSSEAADLVLEQLEMATAHGSCFVAALLESLQRVRPVIADAMTASQEAAAEAVALMMAEVNIALWTLLAKQMEPVAAEILAMQTMASSRGAHYA